MREGNRKLLGGCNAKRKAIAKRAASGGTSPGCARSPAGTGRSGGTGPGCSCPQRRGDQGWGRLEASRRRAGGWSRMCGGCWGPWAAPAQPAGLRSPITSPKTPGLHRPAPVPPSPSTLAFAHSKCTRAGFGASAGCQAVKRVGVLSVLSCCWETSAPESCYGPSPCVRGQNHRAQPGSSKGNGFARFVCVHLSSETDADSQAAARGLLPSVEDLWYLQAGRDSKTSFFSGAETAHLMQRCPAPVSQVLLLVTPVLQTSCAQEL